MQPTEGLSIPRRALDVEDYIDIVRRHKGWIFGPFLFTLVASVVGVYLWPDSYVSEASIKIVPQQVPQNLVQSAINQQMTDRINSMEQTILSRTTLTTIINTFGLYQRERSHMPIEDVVEQMRKKIEILPVVSVGEASNQVPAFRVRFSYENRLRAQQVVQDLVSRFIDENVRNQSNQSFQTTQFLRDQTEEAKKELDGVENNLTQFRVQNNGHLPDQVDGNMRQLQALQANVTYLSNAISRAQQDSLQLETNLRIYEDNLAALKKQPQITVAQQQKSARLAEAEREIDTWQNTLSALRQQYKETYPDVQAAEARLAAAQKKRDAILKEEAQNKKDTTAPVVLSPETQKDARDLDAQIRRTQSAIEVEKQEIDGYNRQLKQTNDAIKTFQGRIETVPLGEQEYGDLLRERDMAKQKYEDLNSKLSRAEIAQDMESRSQGERLEPLDPASLPETPSEPKRPMVISVGAGLGLLLGVAFAGAREMKDTSLKNLKDVRAYTQLAILGSVPLLENDFVVRRRRRLAWLGWTTACLAAAVVMCGSVVYYYATKQ
jgi:protein tyrosine kinase modulator